MYISSLVDMFKFKLASWLLGKEHEIIKTSDKKTFRAQATLIADIMDNFNFKKVQSVMTFLKWKWVSADEGIPTVMEIRREAKKLLLDVCKLCLEQENLDSNTRVVIGTGGLRATAFRSECGKHITALELDFVVTAYDVDAELEEE